MPLGEPFSNAPREPQETFGLPPTGETRRSLPSSRRSLNISFNENSRAGKLLGDLILKIPPVRNAIIREIEKAQTELEQSQLTHEHTAAGGTNATSPGRELQEQPNPQSQGEIKLGKVNAQRLLQSSFPQYQKIVKMYRQQPDEFLDLEEDIIEAEHQMFQLAFEAMPEHIKPLPSLAENGFDRETGYGIEVRSTTGKSIYRAKSVEEADYLADTLGATVEVIDDLVGGKQKNPKPDFVRQIESRNKPK